jgi:hypothetical protein
LWEVPRNQLKSRVLSRKSKITLYETLISPVLAYALETWVLTISDTRALSIFERKVLRSIYGPIKDNNEWRIRYIYEQNNLYEGMDIITFTNVKGASHIFRMNLQ